MTGLSCIVSQRKAAALITSQRDADKMVGNYELLENGMDGAMAYANPERLAPGGNHKAYCHPMERAKEEFEVRILEI
ncbi:MAG: hypothetical protein ACLSBB_11085 [Ruthenibacterium lactatiformans]